MKIKFQAPWHSAVIAICLILAYINIEGKPQDGKVEPSDSDRIYKIDEIDEKAVVDPISFFASIPKGRKCSNGQWIVQVIVVLRKSGKVTDAVIRKESGCKSLDRKALESAQKVRFTPAKKGGNPVSTHFIFQYTATVSGL